LLVHLPCLGRGLFDRLGQLGRLRLGRLLRRFQLAPFGPRRLDLGAQLLILLPQRGELLMQLFGRGDRLGGLGQLLDAPPCCRQRLLQFEERVGLALVGSWWTRRAGDCWIRVGPSSCAPGAGIGIAASSTVLPIPTSVANDGPNQVLANRWGRESSRLMAPVTSTFLSIGNSPKWKQAAHSSRLEAVDQL
jgi:hypothetical protein